MTFHTYRVNEVFSNADGSIQFIELKEASNANGQSLFSGHAITVSQPGNTPHSFQFGHDLPSSQTAGTSVLLATQAFADLGLVTPDFIIPAGFLFTSGGATVNFAGVSALTYTSLPLDGSHSLSGNLSVTANTPTNFAGDIGVVVPPAPPPPITGTAAADTLAGTAAADTIDALGGNDRLTGGLGNDTLNGGDGIDTAVFQGTRAQSTVGGGGLQVSGPDGADVLQGVERLQFSDVSLAFDLGGAAGNTAKLLGAVFGAAAVHDKVYAGIGISLFDQGNSYATVASLAIHAALGSNPSNASLVTLLYTNVVGVAPDAATVAAFTALITGGQFTQTSLTTFAADHELNTAHIGLTGLAETGLEFQPVPG